MRSAFFLACAAVALAAAAACATSEDAALVQLPPNDLGPSPLADAGTKDAEPTRDGAAPGVPSCSAAGWCITSVPDPDLTMRDIWPFESRAFAIAESPTLGVKVLEWDEASKKWQYIDDNSQNAYGFGKYAGKIWAPNENEIYYGVAPGFIYHGKRTSPSSPWSWQRSRLENNSRDTNPEHDPGRPRYDSKQFGVSPADFPALGVWGTSADDVYAWYANTIFHWKSEDGGAPTWVAEHIADDVDNPTDTFFVFGASGSSPDDIWFAGGRGRYDATGVFACPIVIHKTAGGYGRLVDNEINEFDPYGHYALACNEKPGALTFQYSTMLPEGDIYTSPWTNAGWLTHVESAGPNAAVGIMGGRFFAYVRSEDGGLARVNDVSTAVPAANVPSLLNSVWVHGSDAWISGWGLLLRMENEPDKWSTGLGLTAKGASDWDAGTFGVSTTVLGGAPLDAPLYQVRGTSNTNLWAIGARHALHKTTP